MSNKKLYINLHCGLGNRLFKLASAYGISKNHNRNLFISYINKTMHNTSGVNYMETIFRKFQLQDVVESECKQFNEPYESPLTFLDIPNYDADMLIRGYFQNEKYFYNYKNDLIDLFRMEDHRKIYLTNKYFDLGNTFFLHVRRGDYLNEDMHNVNLSKYYINCFSLISPDAKILIFSDDIDFCKKWDFLKGKNISFVDPLENELNSLYLMSLCNLGGIAANSSFSWWGSYLNENPNKLVFFPDKWFNLDWDQSDIGWKNSNVVSIH